MNRALLAKIIFIGALFLCTIGGSALAQDSTSIYPAFNEFVLLEREPQALNLDSLKSSLRIISFCSEIRSRVIFRVLVDEQGKYVRHIVLQNPGSGITKIYEPIIPQIRWKPGILPGGQAGAAWVTVPFDLHFYK